jgi:hypothetical protein
MSLCKDGRNYNVSSEVCFYAKTEEVLMRNAVMSYLGYVQIRPRIQIESCSTPSSAFFCYF